MTDEGIAYIMVGLVWITGITVFTILILNDKPWWAIGIFTVAGLTKVSHFRGWKSD